jgi:hypothetical protein
METIKNWILQTFFQEDLDRVLAAASRAGSMDAFKKAHEDIRETMRDDLEKQAEELANQKLAALLSVIDLSQVIAEDKHKGLIFLGGVKADPGILANLKAEAEFLTESTLWKVLNNTIRELAQRAMFVAGDSLDDMKKGRSILYTLDSQAKIITILKTYQQK